jgi:hypothetical protein
VDLFAILLLLHRLARTFFWRRPLSKLLQKPHIILVKQPDVVDLVTQHRDALDAEPKRPARPD